mmetsp:Transcript_102061/g.304582  ORF Transcript_102061/g.304582 Transcript_102061/m.304582 type:complete len:242 (+) Transcript_102061:457-1182(+)
MPRRGRSWVALPGCCGSSRGRPICWRPRRASRCGPRCTLWWRRTFRRRRLRRPSGSPACWASARAGPKRCACSQRCGAWTQAAGPSSGPTSGGSGSWVWPRATQRSWRCWTPSCAWRLVCRRAWRPCQPRAPWRARRPGKRSSGPVPQQQRRARPPRLQLLPPPQATRAGTARRRRRRRPSPSPLPAASSASLPRGAARQLPGSGPAWQAGRCWRTRPPTIVSRPTTLIWTSTRALGTPCP